MRQRWRRCLLRDITIQRHVQENDLAHEHVQRITRAPGVCRPPHIGLMSQVRDRDITPGINRGDHLSGHISHEGIRNPQASVLN